MLGHAMKVLFIGGCARSGTTMLAGMLAHHPHYCAPQELLFKRNLWEMADAQGNIVPKRVLPTLRSHLHFRIMLAAIPHTAITQLPPRMHWKKFLEWIVSEYARAAYGKTQCAVCIDHSVSNLEQIHFLAHHFPKAKFIHIVRDGRAIAASFKRINWWGPSNVLIAAGWWKDAVLAGLLAEMAFPNRVLRVHYESILDTPEAELQRICQWAELEYLPQMVAGKGITIPPIFRTQHQYVGTGVQKSRKNSWRTELSDREIEIFESLTSELLQFFGYPLQYEKPRAPSRWEWRLAHWHEKWNALVQRIRRQIRIRKYLPR